MRLSRPPRRRGRRSRGSSGGLRGVTPGNQLRAEVCRRGGGGAPGDGLASELSLAATSYQSTVLELTGKGWLGPASASMAAAVAPYVAWMNTTAAAAEQTAHQARAAAAAYEAAFSAHVP